MLIYKLIGVDIRLGRPSVANVELSKLERIIVGLTQRQQVRFFSMGPVFNHDNTKNEQVYLTKRSSQYYNQQSRLSSHMDDTHFCLPTYKV